VPSSDAVADTSWDEGVQDTFDANDGCAEDSSGFLANSEHCGNISRGLRLCGCYASSQELLVFKTCVASLAGVPVTCVGDAVCSLRSCEDLQRAYEQIASSLPPLDAACFRTSASTACVADLMYGVGACGIPGCF